MSDYGFTHAGRVFAPNGSHVDPSDVDARNRAIESAELDTWQTCPDRFVAYYRFEPEPTPRQYLRAFTIAAREATVTTWLGTTIGRITSARVHTNNLGARIPWYMVGVLYVLGAVAASAPLWGK